MSDFCGKEFNWDFTDGISISVKIASDAPDFIACDNDISGTLLLSFATASGLLATLLVDAEALVSAVALIELFVTVMPVPSRINPKMTTFRLILKRFKATPPL